jgi:NADH dehydrogenase FAD-containing subunit
MENRTPKRILIVGGGFAGLTVAMELERKLGGDPSVEITLINRENFFLFTPMLHKSPPAIWTSQQLSIPFGRCCVV